MASRGRVFNGLSQDQRKKSTTGKSDASWIGAKPTQEPSKFIKPWQKSFQDDDVSSKKPSWASKRLLEPAAAVTHARSEMDLSNVKELPVNGQEFTSSEQLNIDDEDDDDTSVSVTISLPKSSSVSKPKFDYGKNGELESKIKFDNEPEELKNWSLSNNERDELKNRLSSVLGRRSTSRSPAPSPAAPPISIAKMPAIPVARPQAQKAKAPAPRRISIGSEDEFNTEHAVKPSSVKAIQPKLEDAGLAQKVPKNINKESLLDQFNAMWDKADEIPDIEIIKCGLPETKNVPEPENITDVEYCIQRLLANDPELKEINLNNMKRTALPQLHRLIEALYNNDQLKKLSLANLGLSDTGLTPLLSALEANESLKVLNLETNYLSGDFLARLFQALLKTQTLEEIKAVNQSVTMGGQAEVAIMKAIHQNRGLWKVSLNLRLPEAKQKIDQALIRNGELRRLKRQIEAMGAQGR